MKYAKISLLLLFIVYLSSCNFAGSTSGIQNEEEEVIQNTWTILVYMAADNDFETAAIEDFYEMESSLLDTTKVKILILLDRNRNYDTTNENWSGSKMFELKTGKTSESRIIQSNEIKCEKLGLSGTSDYRTELNMSSAQVLSTAIKFMYENYDSQNYGLIMWGHGNGWRGKIDAPAKEFKGFAFDESSKTYMSLHQFGEALEKSCSNRKLQFLGFDTCYGGEMEVMYEIKDYVEFSVGSEGLVAYTGWNYRNFFNAFMETELTPEDLCHSAVQQFKESYLYVQNSSIVAVNLNQFDSYFQIFNQACKNSADKITNLEIHNSVMNAIYYDSEGLVDKYTYAKPGYDVYLDSFSLLQVISPDINFEELFQSVFIDNWAPNNKIASLGVYFGTLTTGGYLASTHESEYIREMTSNQIKFVQNCNGYVPSKNNEGSLMDKLFYTQF